MTTIAFLGLGAMGSRMALRLIEAGHDLRVWNRDAAKADALARRGASVAANPREAATGAAIAIAMVRDDEASRQVWLDPDHGALGGLAGEAVGVECSTLTPDWVRTLAREATARGAAFLDAPVAGSRPQAEAGQLVFMVGGETAALARVEPVLRAMGASVNHAGPSGAGAFVKLGVNALLGIQVAAMAELIGLMRASGIDPARAAEVIGATPVASPAAKGAAGSMLAGQFAPLFPVDLVEKDFRYVAEAAETTGSRLPMASAAHAVMRQAVDAGYADENMTGIVRLYT